MPLYGSHQNRASITSVSTTGTWNDISSLVDEISGVKKEALLALTHGFSASYEQSSPVGVFKIDPVTISGFYNDVAATGPHALLGDANVGTERVLKIYVSSAESVKFDVIVQSYERMPKRNELTRFTSVLQPTGPMVTST